MEVLTEATKRGRTHHSDSAAGCDRPRFRGRPIVRSESPARMAVEDANPFDTLAALGDGGAPDPDGTSA
jgi:hypothetical protein